ncbi:MAG TPA: LacI family DNA-binding transcriptional regulator [Candidatus Saccharimonadales bacterium]|nr:LacI family DNA-binding transcriptional regulator [Candidatus Saccharimonadales bacterium]
MPVRMKDIARDLGVSVITVSKALRNHSDISAETRARVLKRSKELNYRPNLAARSLVTGKTSMMGLVVPDLVHSFFSELARGMSGVLRSSGFTLVISSSEQDPELERQAIDQLMARRVDVLLIASTQWTVETFRRLEEAELPYVLIDRNFAGLASNFVGVNDEQVGYIATKHLIDVGCRRIGHITAEWLSPLVGRLEGYKRALSEQGLALGRDYVVSTERVDETGEESGYQAAKKLLKLDSRPDAIFCYNDPVAVGAMKAILEAGLRIPEDVALVGCGNIHLDDYLRVPLTSVDQQSTAIGQKAGRLALGLLDDNPPLRPKTILLEPKLVVRQSSARARL